MAALFTLPAVASRPWPPQGPQAGVEPCPAAGSYSGSHVPPCVSVAAATGLDQTLFVPQRNMHGAYSEASFLKQQLKAEALQPAVAENLPPERTVF